MADKQIVLRKNDGSGAGVLYRTQKEADRFMKDNPGYVVESEQEAQANQDTADEQVRAEAEAKAQAKSEDKAVSAPTRNRG